MGDWMAKKASRIKPNQRVRVVIADDLPEMLDAIQNQLKAHCQVVARAADGVELVDYVRKHKPELLITDISMPRMTGIDALRRLRSMGIKTPAVIVTVHEDEELVGAGLEQGALGFVLKSRLAEELLFAVQAALKGKVFVSERLKKTGPVTD
jgi:DNA-binding NarL/FixJ family response regulator